MIGRTMRAFGADDVALPNGAQKTTFSDDCWHFGAAVL